VLHGSPDLGVSADCNVIRIAEVKVTHMASAIAASVLLTVLSLVFADSDMGAVLCVAIALALALLLIVRAVTRRARQRVMTLLMLAAWLPLSIFLLSHYTLARDHIRWLLLSEGYKDRILAQPVSAKQEFKHAVWDLWGFTGMDTTVYLVFDPTDSLAGATHALPPVKARGLPCAVVRVRRLERQWYAVLFYTETYWGQGSCS
jgi:hypothetical protein